MNPWLSRASEKLHFAELALGAAAETGEEARLDTMARATMLREAAVMHAWGGWLAILNGIAHHLNLPVRDFPTPDQLVRDAEKQGVSSEALTEIGMLRRAGSWLHRLELAWQACWRLRTNAGAAPRDPARLPLAVVAGDDGPSIGTCIAECKAFLERHSVVMEEW